MFVVIRPEILDAELFNTGMPVLIAFLRRDNDFSGQIQAMDRAMRRFEGRVRFCLADEYYLSFFFKQFGIGGTPVYLLFCGEKEVGRFFGHADEAQLEHFIDTALGKIRLLSQEIQSEGCGWDQGPIKRAAVS